MSICRACGEDNPQRARFCLACGAPLDGALFRDEVRKMVTIVRCDVTGWTGLGGRFDPELLRRVQGRFFETMESVVERHGGTVEKFVGDAVIAVFGIPTVREDDALRAVRAAAEMRQALVALNAELDGISGAELQLRIGVNTGEVVTGNDTGSRLVTGDPVSLAARLEAAARPGEILLGEQTARLVRDAVRVSRLDDDRSPAVALLGLVDGAGRSHRRLDSPLVARDHELALLWQAFRGAVEEGAGSLVTVLGAAGVGKSRLVNEFVESVGEQATVLRGRCLPYGEGITFWPVVEAVGQLAGLREADRPDEAAAKIGRLLAGQENAAAISERVAQMIGLVDVTSRGEESFWALRKLLEAAAARRPLILVLDDLHSAEPTFLDLVEHLAQWGQATMLLVCLARTELLDQRPRWGGGSIMLEPFSERECGVLLDNLLGRRPLAEGTRRRIIEAADGNPLFVEETLSMLIDDGLLRQEGDGWVAAADLSTLAIPVTIQALLAARLDRLAPEERHVLERAAIEGKVFHRSALAHLSSEDLSTRVGALLMTLTRKELIAPHGVGSASDEAFRFRHILVRDAAYQGMSKKLRAELHERFADWLEEAVGERVREAEELLGYHLEQAQRYRSELRPTDPRAEQLAARAAKWLASAGCRAFAREDMPAAVNLLSRSVGLLAPLDSRRLELLPNLGAALMDLGRLTDAQRTLDEAARLAHEAGDARIERRALLERAQMSIEPNRVAAEEIRAEAEQAVAVFEQLGDEQGLSKAWRLVGETHLLRCRGAAAEQAMLRAIAHAEAAGDLREKAESFRWLARSTMLGPMPVEAGIARLERARAAAEGNPIAEASTCVVLGALVAMQGRTDEGRQLIATGREVFRDAGLTFRLAQSGFQGRVEMLAGDPARAERELRAGYEVLERMGEKSYYFPLVAALLAHAVVAQGRSREALVLTEHAKQWTTAGDLLAQILWRSARGKALAGLGRIEEGEALAREAVRLSDDTDFLWDRADALMDLTTILRLRGDPAAAWEEPARRALSLYEQKGISIAAERVRGVLAAPVV